jgi:NDP-sugar pyrophosphorylase family protein
MNNSISKAIKITYYREDRPLGTAGALAGINELGERFLVMNGDILTTIDYAKLMKYHDEKGAALTIAVTKKRIKIELGVLLIDNEDNIIGYDEKPIKEFPASTGIYIYSSRVLRFIEPNTYLDFPTIVLRLIDAGEKVVGYLTDSFWLDMGNKDDYERAAKEFEHNRSAFLIE